jgi:colicin import membrane protein
MDVADRQATTRGVLFAIVLHVGLAGFLLATTISCNTFERIVEALGLPKSLNPVACIRPTTLAGPVIEATLVGPAGAPLPPPSKAHAPKPKVSPPKSELKVDKTRPKPPPVKTLPPPPENPDVKDQQKVVALAAEKAKQAERLQKQRERQRMSELDAQQDDSIDKLFKQLDAAKAQSQRAEQQTRRQQQKLAQLKDLENSNAAPTTAPEADQARSGEGGEATGLQAQWLAAIRVAVTQAWLRPDNLPKGVVCPVDITQIPGGQVIRVHVESSCPYDVAGRQSMKNAVMRAQPLPYHGYEKVFKRQITLNFMVKN